MPPLEPRDHHISVAEAAEHTRRHRQARGRAHDINAAAFHKAPILELLAQQGCVGIRLYLARKTDGASTMVAVGVDASGEDLVTSSSTVLEESLPCPPWCATSSPLNA